MNINLGTHNRNCNNIVKKYTDCLKKCGLYQIINEPTRISNQSSTIIDHIVVSDNEKIFQCGVLPTGFSDHYVIYCTRKVNKICINNENVVESRSLRNYSDVALNELIHKLCIEK